MYAVIEVKGHQYLVKPGDKIETEKIDETEKGKEIEIKEVLFYRNEEKIIVGKPYIENASVIAEYIGNKKGKKITVFKFKRRKHYKKKQGHRQEYSILKIKEIKLLS